MNKTLINLLQQNRAEKVLERRRGKKIPSGTVINKVNISRGAAARSIAAMQQFIACFILCSSVYIVNFELAIAGWEETSEVNSEPS